MGDAASQTHKADASIDATLLGVLLMFSGVVCIPLIDVAGKGLGQGYFGSDASAPLWIVGAPMPALQIGFARFALQTVFLAPLAIAAMRKERWRLPRRFGLIVLRAALMACTTVLYFAAIQFLGLAEAISIFFVEPLILTLLAALLLGETLGWRRLSAIAIGLAGAMLIIRPNFLEIGWAALLPLGAAFGFASYLLLTRLLAKDVSSLTLQFWSGAVGTVLLGVLLSIGAGLEIPVLTPIAFEERHLLVLLGLGVVGTIGHLAISQAFRYAEASTLAPLQYFEIFGAALCGYLIFDERLDLTTIAGLALIVGSGLFVLWRERRLQKQRRKES